MLVYSNTDEADVGRIKVGKQASFRVDSFPRETFSGTVSQVRMNALTIQNVVTYNTMVAFDNFDLKLFPGMTAYVSIPVLPGGSGIPHNFFRRRPGGPNPALAGLSPPGIHAHCAELAQIGRNIDPLAARQHDIARKHPQMAVFPTAAFDDISGADGETLRQGGGVAINR